MTNNESDTAFRSRIISMVKSRRSSYQVFFHKMHPISANIHPDYPNGYFIEVKVYSPNRYTNTPPYIFNNEAELVRFLNSFS